MIAAHKIKEKTNFLKIEQLIYKKTIIYEIEVQDPQGKIWEMACRAEGGGTIFQITQELASSSDPQFTEGGVISEEDARAKALDKFPGNVSETEYEKRVPGYSLYEFNIVNEFGLDTRVKVNATSGEIEEAVIEEWEIHWKAYEKAVD